MSMIRRRASAAGLVLGVALASYAALPGQAAHADPPGCTSYVVNFTGGSNGPLNLWTEGECSTNPAYRVLYAEVKQDLAFRPDPVAVSGADAHIGITWDAFGYGCDNNNTAVYYGRAFFSGNTDYHDTAHHTYDTC